MIRAREAATKPAESRTSGRDLRRIKACHDLVL
jgi:hypothetical protein